MRRTLFLAVVLPLVAGFLGMVLAQALALATLGDARALAVVASAQTPFVSVPDTVSPAWQAYLQTLTDPALRPPLPAPDALDAWRAEQEQREAAGRPAADAAVAHYQPTMDARELGGVPVLDVRPRSWQANEKVLVYTHGGSYTFLSARSTLPSSLPIADLTGLRVISVDYTLAPVGKFEQVTDQTVAVIQGLQGEGHRLQDIALVGDSAGGGLAVGAVLKMRDQGLGMPAAVVARSPWADLTDAGDTRLTLAHADPVLVYPGGLKQSADAYADPPDQKQPYVSPVYADFARGFPPTLVQGGTKELLLSDFVRLYRALDAVGVAATLDLYEGMPHVFQRPLPDSPEAQAALTKMKSFIDEHLTR